MGLDLRTQLITDGRPISAVRLFELQLMSSPLTMAGGIPNQDSQKMTNSTSCNCFAYSGKAGTSLGRWNTTLNRLYRGDFSMGRMDAAHLHRLAPARSASMFNAQLAGEGKWATAFDVLMLPP